MNIRPRKDEFAKINAQNIVRIPDSFCEPIIQLTHLSCNFWLLCKIFDCFCVANKTQAMLQRLKETRAHVNVDDLENTFLKGTLVYSGIVNKCAISMPCRGTCPPLSPADMRFIYIFIPFIHRQPGSQLRTKSRGSSPGKVAFCTFSSNP